MSQHAFWSRFKKTFLNSRRRNAQGFTLLELLVVTAIAGGIVAGLTFIVIQMMTADQRESSRAETQREMQMALDYIATELREATYVYPGSYLECSTSSLNSSCTPFTQFLAASVSQDSVPVLAFWKPQAFPKPIIDQCATNNAPAGTACLAGQSYALVVYSLTRNTADPWKGKARITRYVLSQFNSSGVANPGYVDPSSSGVSFTSWPFGQNAAGQAANLQTTAPTGRADTLVDFVDFTFQDAGLTNTIGQTGFCPPTGSSVMDYSISPSNNSLQGNFAGVRSFYACIAAPTTTAQVNGTTVSLPDPGQYRDIMLYLRGSATGRPGIVADKGGMILRSADADILPTMQTRVLSRSVLGRQPAQ
jgi:prepilin-type N-terminal cleavage/methylation domain-containing protein